MRKISIIVLFLMILFSCNSENDYDSKIKSKIFEFYKIAEVKDYKPISFSDLDTIQNIRSSDGSIIRVTGKMTHEYSGRARNGSTNKYIDTFDITIFKDDVIVIPRGY